MSFRDGLRSLSAARLYTSKDYAPVTRTRGVTPGQPTFAKFDTHRGIEYGFKASTWFYRCVTMTMELGSTVPFGLQFLDGGTEDAPIKGQGRWTFDWGHPMSIVLGYWNDDFDPAESIARLLGYLMCGGNCLVGKFPWGDRREVLELRAESPVGVDPVPDGIGGIERYDYQDAYGQTGQWAPDEVCHGRLPALANEFWGLGRLQVLARAIDTDSEAVSLNKSRLEGGGVPDGIIVDKSIMTPDQQTDAQADIDELWGEVSGPFVTGDGVDWIPLGIPQKDLEWLDGRVFTMKEIVTTCGYHPALWGENATLANYDTAELAKWTGGVIPMLNLLGNMFTRGLIPKERRGRERIWYDTSKVEALQRDLIARAKTLVELVSGAVPYDDAKGLLGLPLPDLPGGQGRVPLVADRMSTLKAILDREGLEGAL